MEDNLLELYSLIQVDIIDRDVSEQAIPLQAVAPEHKKEYLPRIAHAFGELQPQEDARNAFIALGQDWPEVSKKIISVDRSVSVINGSPYGVYSCRSHGELTPEEVELLKHYCWYQCERGWGKGYAHCPGEGSSPGLCIHFWQDDGAPLLTREELEAVHQAEQNSPIAKEITPDTFWTLLAQAQDICGWEQEAAAYWLKDRLLTMGPEQARNFRSIIQGYMELAEKYGLWNAAALIQEKGRYRVEFEVFRVWLIAQGKDVYLAALKDPDSLAEVSDYRNLDFYALLYAGDMAYYRLTGRTACSDIDPEDYQQLLSELQQDIVYGPGIDDHYEWSEVATYLPRLCAKYLTPEELRACVHRDRLWNPDNPGIRRARAAVPKKKSRGRKPKRWETR